MSDRTDPEVRKLAEEITQEIYGAGASLDVVNSITDGEAARTLARWESLLAEREADLQAQLHRALGELVGLRGAVADLDPEAGIMPHWIIGAAADLAARFADPDYDVTEDQLRELHQGLIALHDRIDRALTASPLSERAGAVIVASAEETDAEREREACIKAGGIATRELDWGRLPLASDARRDAVDALLAELAKGGDDA